jgi:beta-glucosidase/6-phospho-beta-glucosidase/beta-galactosidase
VAGRPGSADSPSADFAWLTGFECSTFPDVGMDQIALTQHDRFWGGDLVRAIEAGCRTIRYGIRWNVVNPRPHDWDWTSLDGPFELMAELGIEPIVDLFHFGVPNWLHDGVMSGLFPEFQAELCGRFARRYPWVRWYTPTNEPYILAQFGGEGGGWPPYRRGPENFALATRNVARGLCEGWHAIVAERPDARMLVSDTCEYHHVAGDDENARSHAARLNERRFWMHELYGGRVAGDHPFRAWLIEHGIPEGDLDWFVEHPAPLDVVGLDHYPHSEHQYRAGPDGALIDETRPLESQHGPRELARQYFERLGRPLVFAETGAPGDDAAKIAWLDRIVGETRAARADGTPLIGITWWGLIDQVDWGSGLMRYRHDIDPTGLYRLEWRDAFDRPSTGPLEPTLDGGGHRLARVPTATLDAWRRYTSRATADTVGRLVAVQRSPELTLW